jgi:hypothetical protein
MSGVLCPGTEQLSREVASSSDEAKNVWCCTFASPKLSCLINPLKPDHPIRLAQLYGQEQLNSANLTGLELGTLILFVSVFVWLH